MAELQRKTAVPSKDGLLISCWIQPRASRNALAGLHGDALKVALTAPPVDGKANEALREFLADEFGLPKSAVEIVSGQTGRSKRVSVKGLSLEAFERKLKPR